MGSYTTFFGALPLLDLLIHINGSIAAANAAISFYASTGIAALRPLVMTTMSIFVMGYGFALMQGKIKEPFNDAYIRVIKISVVAMFATNFANYNLIIIQNALGLPDYLLSLFLPAAIRTSIQAFTPITAVAGISNNDLAITLISVVMTATVDLMYSGLNAANALGQTDPTAFAAGLGVGIAGAGLSAVVASILIIARISLAVLLAIGPFFFIAILFEKTKPYFEGWLTQVLNFTVVIFLMTITIYILFPILIITVGSYYLIANSAGSLTLRESVELITLLGIFLAVVKQVPTTVAALVRGYAVNAPQERGLMSSSGKAGQSGGKTANEVQQEVNSQRNRTG